MWMIDWCFSPIENMMDFELVCRATDKTSVLVSPNDEITDCVPSIATTSLFPAFPGWIKWAEFLVHWIALAFTFLGKFFARFLAHNRCRVLLWMFPTIFKVAISITKDTLEMRWLSPIAFLTVWAGDIFTACSFTPKFTKPFSLRSAATFSGTVLSSVFSRKSNLKFLATYWACFRNSFALTKSIASTGTVFASFLIGSKFLATG